MKRTQSETNKGEKGRPIPIQVLALAWPVVIEQLLGTAVNLANMYIVGHLGAEALTAVGLSTQLSALLIAFFSAVGVGSTALIARHIGAKEPQEANRIAGQSLLLAIGIGLITALPCLLLGRPLLTLLGGGEEVVALGRPYLMAIGTTMPLMAILYIGNASLRGAGDTRTPMIGMGIVNLVNVAISWSLVRGLGPLPALGVTGAGIGAATGVGIGGLFVGGFLLRGHGIRVSAETLRFDPVRTGRLLRVGLPSGAEQMVMRIAQLTMTTAVTQLGNDAYAGHQLGIRLLSVAFMPGFALSVAAATLVGQELGREEPQRAEASAYTASWIALGVMCSVGLVIFLFAEPLLQAFTNDPDVVAQGLYAMKGCALIQPPLAWYYVLSGALRGAGDTRFALLVQGSSIWLVRLPLAFRLSLVFGLGLTGIWVGMILDMTARAAMLLLRFRSGTWKQIVI